MTYEISESQIAALATLSENCEQHFRVSSISIFCKKFREIVESSENLVKSHNEIVNSEPISKSQISVKPYEMTSS